ncbi:hypothetical protein PVL29_011898 [Vitis rotundifolia]|uniref:Uncharacterized protein n=1 Tax=Vitis rotundifolia TaxID=103349 RepID=A0AA39DRF8_VITRO|nr:hypothetical protein PVL29_011898 [Vitis rotundifolia]
MYLKSQLGLPNPSVLLLLLCFGIVAAWLVSKHWISNNLLGISICIAFVSYANVMVSVAAQQASNLVHMVAELFFRTNLFGGVVRGGNFANFMMFGLVLCFNHRKSKDSVSPLDIPSAKGHKYIWYAILGYAIRLVTALAADVLTHHQQNLPLCTPGPHSCMATFGMQSQISHPFYSSSSHHKYDFHNSKTMEFVGLIHAKSIKLWWGPYV